jgi:hypothetical protein
MTDSSTALFIVITEEIFSVLKGGGVVILERGAL